MSAIIEGGGGSSSQSSAVATDDSLIVSQSSYDRKVDDLDLLNKEKIPANSQAIEAARELGDLRENAEYQMAKDEQKILLSSIAFLFVSKTLFSNSLLAFSSFLFFSLIN